MTGARVERWGPCPDCGTEGWYSPGALHLLDPRTDHDWPDGRRCRASAAPRVRVPPVPDEPEPEESPPPAREARRLARRLGTAYRAPEPRDAPTGRRGAP